MLETFERHFGLVLQQVLNAGLVLVIMLLASCSISTEQSKNSVSEKSLEEQTDQYIQMVMDSFDIKGAVAVGVVKNEQTILEKVYGYFNSSSFVTRM